MTFFVSYSSNDVAVANDVCRFLEETGLHCWITPRNIVPGREYGENISDAIPRSKCVCLLFSSHSNKSPHVASEIAMAFDNRVNILPVRIKDVPMNEDLGYRFH
ncbi:MAG: toll/interleukin-1 receptor domain-containing protein [Kiritimatiellae bacterium]|nr:toll/interleukin-1 receptor domain-containing protein [Kiritimatiellia bacterium]